MTAGVLHVLVPRGVDDPLRPSGGNTYDRRVCAALRDLGWLVEVGEVEGGWPWTAGVGRGGLRRALDGIPDGSVVLVDGLLASRLPEVVVPAGARLRVVLLVHLPVGCRRRAGPARGAAGGRGRRVGRHDERLVPGTGWCRSTTSRRPTCTWRAPASTLPASPRARPTGPTSSASGR